MRMNKLQPTRWYRFIAQTGWMKEAWQDASTLRDSIIQFKKEARQIFTVRDWDSVYIWCRGWRWAGTRRRRRPLECWSHSVSESGLCYLHGGVFTLKIQCGGRFSLLSIEEKSIANNMAVGPVELPCVLYWRTHQCGSSFEKWTQVVILIRCSGKSLGIGFIGLSSTWGNVIITSLRDVKWSS